tara:strand:+ start:87 stop:335 length:249 start_codon:yes stop_codon:yes gene_type:complete
VRILKDLNMTSFLITKKNKKFYESKIESLPSSTKNNKQYAIKFFEYFTCKKYKKSSTKVIEELNKIRKGNLDEYALYGILQE